MKLALIILLSLLPVISIFRSGTYESGDLSIHVTKAMDFWEVLSEGNLRSQWTHSLNAGYGYPLYIFSYVAPYYFSSAFHLLGFSFLASVKLGLALFFTGCQLLAKINSYIIPKARLYKLSNSRTCYIPPIN